MRAVLLGLALTFAVPLGGCATLAPPSAHIAVTAKQTRIAANRLYVASVSSLKVLEAQGLISADKRRELANELYQRLLQVRAGQMGIETFSLIVSGVLGER